MSKFQRTFWCVVCCVLVKLGGAVAQPGTDQCDRFEKEVSASSDIEAIWSEVTSSFKAGCYDESLALALDLKMLEAEVPNERTYAYLILNQLRLGNKAAVRSVVEEAKLVFGPYVLKDDCDPLDSCWGGRQLNISADSHILEIPVIPIMPRSSYPGTSDIPEEGSCDVRFNVGADGQPDILETICSHPAFKQLAESAVLSAEFPPKIIRGKPVERRNVVYPLTFKLGTDASKE